MDRLGERLLIDDDHVRVWEDIVEVAGQQAMHRHERPYLSVAITGGRGEIVGADGDVRYAFERAPGQVRYFGPADVPVTHALRNTGEAAIRVIVVELLDAGQRPDDARAAPR